MREQDRWISDHVACLRMEKLVYVRYEISKGSFYHPTLQYNQWTELNFNDINWHEDHVFSFILPPLDRYISGIAFDLFYNPDLMDILLDKGPDLLKRLLIITPHSIPVHNIFFDHANNIDWIPAGVGFNDQSNFKKLLDHHSLEIEWNADVTRNGWKTILSIKEKIRGLLENDIGIGNRHMWSMLAKDLDLYKKILDNFDDSAASWPDVSWKNKYKL